jgi:hypothetical protein
MIAAQHGVCVVPVEAQVLVQQALQLAHEIPHQRRHLLLPMDGCERVLVSQ